jgi:hypothetical protein
VSARLTRWTEKLMIPVQILLVCTILGAIMRSDVLYGLVSVVKDFSPRCFLAD